MPETKNAGFRHRVIDNCLRNTRKNYNSEKLLEAVSEAVKFELGIEKGISRRTLFSDLKQMQADPPIGYGAPIDINYEGHYFYTDPDFSITNCPLVESDADKLHEALVILKQFSSLPQFDGIESIIKKLEYKSALKGKVKKHVVEFEKSENSKGLNYLEILYNSAIESKAIQMEYKPFHHTEATSIVVHPYLLKEYNNRWFLMGLNNKSKQISIFALDRIERVQPANEVFIENEFFTSADYFKSIIGVSLPEKRKITFVRVKIFKPRAFYVLTKPLHATQRVIRETSKYIVFEWELIPNNELISFFLSFGCDLMVITPSDLKILVKEKINDALKNYKGLKKRTPKFNQLHL